MKWTEDRFWMLAPDNGGDGEVQFSKVENEDDFEVVVSDEPERETDPAPGLTKEELLREIERQKEAIEAARNRGDEVAALRQGLAELGMNLRQTEAKESAQAKGEVFDEEAYRKKFNEEFYNDPYQFMQDFAVKKLAPEFQRLAQRQEVLMKREISRDPERRETFEKYRKEIEQEFEAIPAYERYSDPQAFERAHDRVVARHLNEIIEARVREALEATKDVEPAKASEASRSSNFNEHGGVGGPGVPKARPQIRLTTKEAQWAKIRGLTPTKAHEVLSRRPELKTAINR